MTSYDVKSGDSSTLAAKINSSQTSGIMIAAMNINGALASWANTAGVLEVTEEADATIKKEWIYYTGTSVDSTTKISTLSGVVRGIAKDSSDVTTGDSSIAQPFSKGATVRFVTFHDLLNKKLNTDRDDTIDSGIKLQFASSANYIKGVTNDLSFKDGNNSLTTLSQLTAAAGTDTKARVSNDDTTSGFLNGKLTAGTGITFTENSGGANETLDIAITNPVTVATGGSGRQTATAYSLLCGGTTATGAHQSVASVGTSGQLLVSAGASNLPTFQDAKYLDRTVTINAVTSATGGAGGTSEFTFATHQYTVPASWFDVGYGIEWDIAGTHDAGNIADTFLFGPELGGTNVCSASVTLKTASAIDIGARGILMGTATPSGSAEVRGFVFLTMGGDVTGFDYGAVNVATNGTLLLSFFGQPSGATNSGSTITMSRIRKISTTAV